MNPPALCATTSHKSAFVHFQRLAKHFRGKRRPAESGSSSHCSWASLHALHRLSAAPFWSAAAPAAALAGSDLLRLGSWPRFAPNHWRFPLPTNRSRGRLAAEALAKEEESAVILAQPDAQPRANSAPVGQASSCAKRDYAPASAGGSMAGSYGPGGSREIGDSR